MRKFAQRNIINTDKIMEIMSGKETRVREKREKIMEFLSEFTVLDFDRERAVLAGEVIM